MPIPTQAHLAELGPEILPFERNAFRRVPSKGELIVFDQYIYDATENNIPSDAVLVSKEQIAANPSFGRYLWVIDKNGLRIILESISNPESQRGIMCHTNLTGGNKALQGGELWFGHDKTVFINWYSGRYGYPSLDQWITVVEYFRYVGYTKLEQLI